MVGEYKGIRGEKLYRNEPTLLAGDLRPSSTSDESDMSGLLVCRYQIE